MEKVKVEAVAVKIGDKSIEFICEGGRVWAPREAVRQVFLETPNDILNALGEQTRFDKMFGEQASSVIDGRSYISGEVVQFVLSSVFMITDGPGKLEDLRAMALRDIQGEVEEWEETQSDQ